MSKLITPQIMALRKKAMLAKDEPAKRSLQALSAAFKNKQFEKRDNKEDEVLTAEEEISIVVKLCKQRKESIAMFEKADRKDLVLKESTEIAFLEEFLPKALTDEEVMVEIDSVIEAMGGEVPKSQMGQVMGKLSHLKGKADMGKVSGIVRGKLV